MTASTTQRIRGLLRSIPPTFGCTDSRWGREFVEHAISDEALIDATQGIDKSLQNFFSLHHDQGKLFQLTSALELLSVVDDNLDAKHALAFGINLQSQLATVHLEYRQIIRRFLDRYFPLG